MRLISRWVVSVLLSLGCVISAHAAPCLSQSLDDYLVLPAAGCNIGPLKFSDFTLPDVFPPATALDPANVLVAPITGALGTGFSLQLAQSAAAGEFFSLRLGFNVSEANLVGAYGALIGPEASGVGVVTLLEDFCLGGIFSDPTNLACVTASTANLLAIAIEGFSDPAATVAFSPDTLLGVVADIGVDAGDGFVAGAASLNGVELRFLATPAGTAVPSPSVLMLLAIGVLGIAATPRKRSV